IAAAVIGSAQHDQAVTGINHRADAQAEARATATLATQLDTAAIRHDADVLADDQSIRCTPGTATAQVEVTAISSQLATVDHQANVRADTGQADATGGRGDA